MRSDVLVREDLPTVAADELLLDLAAAAGVPVEDRGSARCCPAVSLVAQRDHDRLQVFALLGQVVLVVRRALGLAAFHQPSLDETVQPGGEDISG
jgi:hypothetical protein